MQPPHQQQHGWSNGAVDSHEGWAHDPEVHLGDHLNRSGVELTTPVESMRRSATIPLPPSGIRTQLPPNFPYGNTAVSEDGRSSDGEVTPEVIGLLSEQPRTQAIAVDSMKSLQDLRRGDSGTPRVRSPATDIEGRKDVVRVLEEKLLDREGELRTTRQSVIGKFIHDARLMPEYLLGMEPVLALEEERARVAWTQQSRSKWRKMRLPMMTLHCQPIKIGWYAFLAVLFYSIVETVQRGRGIDYRWACNTACGQPCGTWDLAYGVERLSDCLDNYTFPSVGLNNSHVVVQAPECYLRGLFRTAFLFTNIPCSSLPPPSSVPHTVLSHLWLPDNSSSPMYAYAPLQSPPPPFDYFCIRISAQTWHEAAMVVDPPVLRKGVVRKDAAARLAYAEMAGRVGIGDPACSSFTYGVNRTTGRWVSTVRTSPWRRYLVAMGSVLNNARLTFQSVTASVEGRFSQNIDSIWVERSRLLNDQFRLDLSENVVMLKTTVNISADSQSVHTTTRDIHLQCAIGEPVCNMLQLMEVDDLSSPEWTRTVQVVFTIEFDSQLELSWEDFDIRIYHIDWRYTLMEVILRYVCAVLVLAAAWKFARECYNGPGWGGLLLEQVWVVYLLALVFLLINPLFLLTLYQRDLSSVAGRVGLVFEADFGYWAYYGLFASHVVFVSSARARYAVKDLGQVCCGPMRKVSIPGAVALVCLLCLIVIGAVERGEEGYQHRYTGFAGAGTIQHDAALCLFALYFVHIIIATVRARTKLRHTHYISSRRRQILLRVVTFHGVPVILSVIASASVEWLARDTWNGEHRALTDHIDAHTHQPGIMCLIVFYVLSLSVLLHPLKHSEDDLPNPTDRQGWTTRYWTAAMRMRLMQCGGLYYFISYEEEERWLATQGYGDSMVVGALLAVASCIDVIGDTAEVGEQDRDEEEEDPIFRSKRPVPVFNLQLASEMAILSQEVYLNPPLMLLLRTRADGPSCCVLVAAAVLPNQFVKDKLETTPRAAESAPKRLVRRDTGQWGEWQLPGPMQIRTRSAANILSESQQRTEADDTESEDVDSVSGEDVEADDDRPSEGMNFELQIEGNNKAWKENISRSYMNLSSFNWTLRWLLDRRDNRVIVVSKVISSPTLRAEPPRASPTPSFDSVNSWERRVEPSGYYIIAVVFRGTRNKTNIKTDLKVLRNAFHEMAEHADYLPCAAEKPQIHAGFRSAWKTLKHDVMGAVEKEVQRCREEHIRLGGDENPTIRIVCSGHSLGGALAVLAAYAIQRQHPSMWVSLYNFGTPRIGNASFCSIFNKLVPDAFRVIYPADPIPNHPPKCSCLWPMYDHPGNRVRVDDVGNLIINPSWSERTFMDTWPFSLLELHGGERSVISAHSMKVYRTALRAAANWVGQDYGLAASLKRA